MKIILLLIHYLYYRIKRFLIPKDKKSLQNLVEDLKYVDTNQVFQKIQPGDIVIGILPCSLSQLQRIAPTHRIRPFIVAKKEKDYILAYCGTSNQNRKYQYFLPLLASDYRVSKDGNINLSNVLVLPPTHILYHNGHLHYQDILSANESIYLSHPSHLQPSIDVETPIHAGQIVRKERQLFYIYSLSENIAQAYKLYSHDYGNIRIPYRDKVYSIHETKPLSIDIHNGYIPVSLINTSYIDQINAVLHPTEKKVHPSNENYFEKYHTYTYPVGQTFSAGFNSIIYLFTCKGIDYGLYSDDLEDDEQPPQIRRVDITLHRKAEILNEEELIDAVDRLSFFDERFTWLYYELLDKQNEQSESSTMHE